MNASQAAQRAILIASVAVVSACASGEAGMESEKGGPVEVSSAANPATAPGLTGRDIEAPEVFEVSDQGLWDGRPSLGGVWVAHSDVKDPERVIIRNEATGKVVIGALFRRERENPGPRIQVSSDAAAELGMLAGAPADLHVTALRREAPPAPEAAVAAEEELPAAAPAEEAEAGAADAPPAEEALAAAPAEQPAAAPAEKKRRGLFSAFRKKQPEPAAPAADPASGALAAEATAAIATTSLDAPAAEAAPAPAEAAPALADETPRQRKGLFGRRSQEAPLDAVGLADTAETAPAESPAPPAADEPKRRGLFGRRKAAEAPLDATALSVDTLPAEAAAAPAEPPAPLAAEEPPRRKGLFGRRKAAEAPLDATALAVDTLPAEPAAAPAEPPAPLAAEEPPRRKGLFGRRKAAEAPLDATARAAGAPAGLAAAPVETAGLTAEAPRQRRGLFARRQSPQPETLADMPLSALEPVEVAAVVEALAPQFVRVGLYPDRATAETVSAELRAGGVLPTLRQSASEGRLGWLVLVGPAMTVADREAVLDKVKDLGFPDAYLAAG